MSPKLLDRAGILVSSLCLLHCMALPLVAFSIPSLGALVAVNETLVHIMLLGCALPISYFAFRHGYTHHQDVKIVVLGVSGLVLLILGISHLFGESSELWLTVPGAILLFMAHMRNWRYHHSHTGHHHHHTNDENTSPAVE